MSKSPDKKVQTTISEDSERDLNKIINAISLEQGVLFNQSQYIRELILKHIRDYKGEQISYVNEKAKQIIENFEKTKD